MPTFRRAENRDAAGLSELAERTFRDTFGLMNTTENMCLHCEAHYNEAIQAQEICDPSISTLICEHENHFIGFVQVRWGSAPNFLTSTRPAEIQRLYVDQQWHGSGVAHNLMTEALNLVESGGADQVWLGVWEHNPRAVAFYKKFGFSEIGEHVFPLGNDPQRDIVMARLVNPK